MPALQDLRVLDLSTGAAGPMATMLLAMQGADVVRVRWQEDVRLPPHPGSRAWQRGKRTIDIDLLEPAGRAELLSLAERADVLVESFEPGRASRLGLDYAATSR